MNKNQNSTKQMAHDNLYNKTLRNVERSMGGRGGTMTDQLQKAGGKWLGSNFNGVFASNRIPKKFKTIIVNLDPDTKNGSHWVAMGTLPSGDIMVYDTFGRPTHKILPKFKRRTIDTDHDAEQRRNEDNCGQRCIAWLYIFLRMGPQFAQLI